MRTVIFRRAEICRCADVRGGQSSAPRPGDAPLRLLSQRRQEPSGGRPAAAHGVY